MPSASRFWKNVRKFLSSPVREPCRRLWPNQGRTFQLSESSLEHVAFTGCDTSLGVFFIVDKERCFAANIEVIIQRSSSPDAAQDPQAISARRRTVEDQVRRQVRDALDAEHEFYGWGSLWLDATMRDKLVIIGRGAQRFATTEADYARWVVGDAVQTWLGIPGSERADPKPHVSAVVKFSGNIKDRTDQLDAAKWELRAVGNARMWRIVVTV